MQQSSATPKHWDWVAEDCCIISLLLAVPSCIYSFWHGVIPTSYTSLLILVSLIFYPGLALTVARGEMPYTYVAHALHV